MQKGLPVYQARRVVSSQRRGSSRPVVVETAAGYFFTKLRGAAQGTAALVAEIVVAALAEALDLWVPAQALIVIDAATPSDDQEDELLDLLSASSGLNLGFQYLPGARDLRPNEIEAVDEALACQVLWLDSLVMNVDRRRHNPNLMWYQGQLWLIDHGAALPFQYNWTAVREHSPRQEQYAMAQHLFWPRAQMLDQWDEPLAAKLSAPVLQAAIAKIPDCFLAPLLASPQPASADQLERRRQAYAAFLWKRLKSPRPFMNTWLAHHSQAHESTQGDHKNS